ncbi:Meiosis-specific protein HOP1 [Pichia kudriavzevii]|uniref:Meiosis-specific protein HOP1 n=1 Tax=Pichia kudriavzevii TaxID=4909 RepID=A0A1V2LGN1_PICKU|nr:Meiosis-specific protein HOP1 [Pichia kudriavzevii]
MSNMTMTNTNGRRRVSERFTKQQSERTVIDILTISISCIFFLRGFFHDSFFTDDKFYINKDLANKKFKKDYIRVKKIKRNVSDDVDMILNWINISIQDALHKKYLKAINVSILLDDKVPAKVFESYVFDVKYSDIQPESISFNDDILISPVELTKLQIFNLLKKIILLTQALPPLPSKKFLSMRLLFNDKCPNDYYPEYFTDCTNCKPDSIRIPVPVYNDIVADCGGVNSVHHNVTAKLASLSTLTNSDYENANIIDVDPFEIFGCMKEENDKEKDDIISLNTQVSQVTKDLYDMLTTYENQVHDGETQVHMKSSDAMSLTTAAEQIGFTSTQMLTNQKISRSVIDAFSVLIYKGLLSFKAQKSFNHNIFSVEFDGLLVENKPISIGKYFVQPNFNNRNTINKLLDLNFNRSKSFQEILADYNQSNDETMVEDENYSETLSKYKKMKISKSKDIFQI